MRIIFGRIEWIWLLSVIASVMVLTTASATDAIILHCEVDQTSQALKSGKFATADHQSFKVAVTISNELLKNGHHQRTVRAVGLQPLFSIAVDSDAGPEHTYSFDRSDSSQWFVGMTETERGAARTQFVKIQKGSGYFIYGDNITDSTGTTLNTISIQGNCAD